MTIVVRNLSDQLVDLVRDRILAGVVPIDQAIRQDALAAELGVSKIPLREALTRLEQEGLVRSQANRGFFVRSLNADEAEEVYALRVKLEPEAVALASRLATDEERQHAIDTLATLDQVTHEHGEGVGAFNRAFHMALIRPARRPIVTNILERLHVLSDRYVRKHLEPLGRDERANEEHRQMLAAWLERDDQKVAAQLSAHIVQTMDDLRRQLEAGQSV
jgi:DNA-binding GntR family transcriptional regulator